MPPFSNSLKPLGYHWWLFLLKQALFKRFILWLMCALLGSGILISAHIDRDDSWLGDVYGVLTGFFFTGYIIAVGYCRKSLSTADTMLYSSGFAPQFYCHYRRSGRRGSPCCPALSRDG